MLSNNKELKHFLRFFLSMGCSRTLLKLFQATFRSGSLSGDFPTHQVFKWCLAGVAEGAFSASLTSAHCLFCTGDISLRGESGNLGPYHCLALSQIWFERIPQNILWLESGLWMKIPELCLVSSALAAGFHPPEHFYPVYPNTKIWN